LLVLTGSASAAEIQLDSGDRLTGSIVSETPESLVLDHPSLGRLEIAMARIASIDGGENAARELADIALAQLAEAEEEASPWKTSVRFGLAATFGNTDEQTATAGVDSKRETDETRLILDGSYYYSQSDGDRTDNKFTAGVRHDWLLPDSKWFFFAQGRYDYDEFESWEHRFGGHGGIGYEFITSDEFDLRGRIGAGATKEWKSDDEDLKPEGLLGLDLRWQIKEGHSFILGTTLFPDLGDFGEFRWVTRADYSLLLSESLNMSFTIGLRDEYQSEVDPGSKHNDLRITAGLQFDF
jgi:putative salt-induced outer membrane protein YdiY